SGGACGNTNTVNEASAIAFLGAAYALWLFKVWRHPGTPRWQLGFPILVVLLLSNKVYSPQYSLWLLPWFALALPDLRWFVAFELTDIAVFVTRFSWFGANSGPMNGWTHVMTFSYFEWAIIARAVVLVGCVVAFLLRAPPEVPEEVPARVVTQAVAA